jgi:precorrin-2 dehydrogenase/sirohydrochlorin ferrochelatase
VSRPGLRVETRPFRDQDCDRRVLVFACTNDPEANDAVARAATACGVPCCRADGARGDFSTGAVLRRGEVCVAVSTTGSSPVLAVEARDRIAAVVGEEYAVATRMLGDLRDRLRDNVADASARAGALRGSLTSDLLEALRGGNDDEARALVEKAYASACPSDSRTASIVSSTVAPGSRQVAQGGRCIR